MKAGSSDFNNLFSPSAKISALPGKLDFESPSSPFAFLVRNIPPGATVLDARCHYGQAGEYLAAKKNCAVYGIETDEEAVKSVRAKGVFKDVFRFSIANPEAAPGEYERFRRTDFFDALICPDVFEHVKDINGAFFFLISKLKTSGKMLLPVPNIANLDIIANLLCDRFSYTDIGILNRDHARFFTKRSFIEWLNSVNSSRNDFQIDVETWETTNYESPAVKLLKEKFPALYDNLIGLYADRQNALTLLNLFALVKKPGDKKIALLQKFRLEPLEELLDRINKQAGKNSKGAGR
ncbi:MAG: methyltransferase domain-containing protein [Planctomycetes bacterium]|nr:methyltransferase domain-containing protein [Planctomycetota bacterium]